jgi:hypothetical protein
VWVVEFKRLEQAEVIAEAEEATSVAEELRALGVSEPTEEERFLRREEQRTRQWLKKTTLEGGDRWQ